MQIKMYIEVFSVSTFYAILKNVLLLHVWLKVASYISEKTWQRQEEPVTVSMMLVDFPT